MTEAPSFLESFGLSKGSVVCIVGAGGKTSLMFHLASEARSQGHCVYVSTTTRILIPGKEQYDELDLSGAGITLSNPAPGIYVSGKPVSNTKMCGVDHEVFAKEREYFDIIFLEADGAAGKSLKGWLAKEPVIPIATTHTIGVVDITTVGKTVSSELVHRLDLFCKIAGIHEGDTLTVENLYNMITHEMGLFFQARGRRVVFINKVETEQAHHYAKKLASLLEGYTVCMGSVHSESVTKPFKI